jgi:hypothetical protein
MIPSSICFLGFRQRNYLDIGSKLLDLVFTDVAYFSLVVTGKSITQLDQQYAIAMNFTMLYVTYVTEIKWPGHETDS